MTCKKLAKGRNLKNQLGENGSYYIEVSVGQLV